MRIDWIGTIIPKVKELLGSYSYRPTLRQIFYRLVAALLISNTESTYKSLSRATVVAREEATIDPLAFQDRVRTHTNGDYGYNSPDEFIDDGLDQLRESPENYTRPMWTTQQTMPIIWLEKDYSANNADNLAREGRPLYPGNRNRRPIPSKGLRSQRLLQLYQRL
ncbi:hypothetical protein ES705_10341 [subsurface metagenome]